jgi:hypothetical protein
VIGAGDLPAANLARDVGTQGCPCAAARRGLRGAGAAAVSLRDDMRAYLPGLLPRFIALFGEAERGGGYELVRPALGALEALGATLGDHLPLLLPALVRLIHPGAPPPPTPTPTHPRALEALGAMLGDHLPLLLPALMRLIHPGAHPCTTPLNTPQQCRAGAPCSRERVRERVPPLCCSRGQHIAPLAW